MAAPRNSLGNPVHRHNSPALRSPNVTPQNSVTGPTVEDVSAPHSVVIMRRSSRAIEQVHSPRDWLQRSRSRAAAGGIDQFTPARSP